MVVTTDLRDVDACRGSLVILIAGYGSGYTHEKNVDGDEIRQGGDERFRHQFILYNMLVGPATGLSAYIAWTSKPNYSIGAWPRFNISGQSERGRRWRAVRTQAQLTTVQSVTSTSRIR